MELVGEPSAFPTIAAGGPLTHQSREYCEMRVYYGVDAGVEDYLRDVFVPACNRNGEHKQNPSALFFSFSLSRSPSRYPPLSIYIFIFA